ncbi:D-alanyl-D-alanine carboxypeptidase family protein [Miniphocaeibacter halophilus]|uniref:D-alanyl-D-alanine carboxypeptidase n=1 Tax=Miniphocaeibacter halophilus TaxID=2931922 RepID=A0AC61MQH5_9FIRM|nr:D-alanyl-D-alanine carboxypeptidase family protein [Miniphocaeibacter halophilus]QQK07199.1 D-alanyl-D-alanine carboxypeptidase [Miniphocaeibacter halophilus]
MKKKKQIFAFILTIILIFSNISFAAIPGFEDSTKGYIIAEFDSDTILSSYNEDEVVSVASITKLMTYILTKEAIKKGSLSLTDSITVTEDIASVGGSSLSLSKDQNVTIEQLLKGLVIVSGNDAAYALAKTVGGSEEEFTKLMNEKAKEIGLEKANFVNASGLPDPETKEENTMTVRDVYTMSRYVLETYPEILELTSTKVLEIPELQVRKESTIPLLGEIAGIDGLKTGTTDAAGYCLVSTFKPISNETLKEHRFISVIMGANSNDDRRNIAEIIFNYINGNYINGKVVDEDEIYKELKINSIDSGVVEVYPKQTRDILYDKTEGLTISGDMNVDVKGPIKSGDKVGVLSIRGNNGKVYDVDLIVKEDYNKAGFGTRLKRMFLDIYENMKLYLNF